MASSHSQQRPHSRSPSVSSSSSSPEPPLDDDGDFFLSQRNDSVSSIAVSENSRRPTPPPVCERPKEPIERLPPEILIAIFAKLSSPSDLYHCMLVSKSWARNSVDLLWHRPLCNTWPHLKAVADSIESEGAYYPYVDLVRRLNLSNLSETVNNGTLEPFKKCKRIERLTLTSCSQVTDSGIMEIVDGNRFLLALDITGLYQITDQSIQTLATHCSRLQGLNITGCRKVSDESLMLLAEQCRHLKRLKLNKCHLITDRSIVAFANNCPSMLEIDLQECRAITDASVTALLSKGRHLRELRLAQCILITDLAFSLLPEGLMFDSLRILDLTACSELHDSSVEKIIDSAPRLRILVLAKCTQLTDKSVLAICKLGKNLHDIHLGRCGHISDRALKELVKTCNRIRYIDLAGCTRVTDASVRQLATLPKLRRIGLVKCQAITDQSILALAKSMPDPRIKNPGTSSLERVHLSYCTNITLEGIHELLMRCPKLTHLSLTGIQAFFMRQDLLAFCREAPSEFNDEQRTVFCVFSGDGVNRLRHYLNSSGDSPEMYTGRNAIFEEHDEDGGIQVMMESMEATAINNHAEIDDEMDFEADGGDH